MTRPYRLYHFVMNENIWKTKVEAMRALRRTQALILADANALPLEEGGLRVEIRSLAEWLSGGD